MSTKAVLDRLTAEREESVAFIDQTMEAVEEESRDLSDTEQRSLEHHRNRMAELDAQIKPLVEFLQTRASAVQIDQRIRTAPRPAAPAAGQTRGPVGFAEERVDLGQLFVESEQYRASGGDPRSLGRVRLPDVQTRAVLVESADPGQAWLPSAPKWMAPTAALTTPLLDLIQRVPVSGDSVDIVSLDPEVTGADVVAEGGDKPEVTFTATSTPTPLETIAGWVQISRQLLADAPAARTIVNNGLTRSVLKKLQDEVSTAIGAASIPATTGASGAGLLEVIREGMATVEAAGYLPNVLLGAPADLAALDVSIMGLTLLGPSGNSAYWGLRPIAVPGMTSVYVADAASAFALFERTGVEIYATDSDIIGAGSTAKSAFRANVFTILGETRAKGAVVNSAAATEIVLTP